VLYYLVRNNRENAGLENTEHLRQWIDQKVESQFAGNLSAFAEKTRVSRQTWMNILNRKYSSLRQQAVSDLCGLFSLTEIDLYLIAHPAEKNNGTIAESTESYRIKDQAERLAEYLRSASEEDREFIFTAAERCGFTRYDK